MPDVNKLSFIQRKNTVCIDIKQVAGPKVPPKDWVGFLKDDVKLQAADVIECQVHSVSNFLLVKLKDEATFNQVCSKLHVGIPWTAKGGAKVYGWSTQEALASVKIINMTVHIDEKMVLKHMETYGTVVHHRFGYVQGWKNVRDGSLFLKMKLKEGVVIPTYLDLTTNGEILQIFSDHQEKICFRCLGNGHISAFCKQKVKDFDSKNKSKSWASVTAGDDVSSPSAGAGALPSPPAGTAGAIDTADVSADISAVSCAGAAGAGGNADVSAANSVAGCNGPSLGEPAGQEENAPPMAVEDGTVFPPSVSGVGLDSIVKSLASNEKTSDYNIRSDGDKAAKKGWQDAISSRDRKRGQSSSSVERLSKPKNVKK